jgi:nucleotide-binding universal stress UspA family protein
MPLPKNILYPVDFSDRCRLVWPAVVSMARQLAGPVTLLHALNIDYSNEPFSSAGVDEIRERLRQKLDEFLTPASDIRNVCRKVEYGAAAACILDCAEKIESPLIMMPTRGHTRFRQLLLGSVTAAVLHDAGCPVWTEAHTAGESAHTGLYRSIVCAVDMGPRTHEVLRAASEFGKSLGAELYIVHSVPGIDPRISTGVAERTHSFLVANAREDFPVHCAQAGVDARLEIVEDLRLVDGIVEAASKHSADLLVIGRGVIQGTLGRLRTNAHNLIRHSLCPVLSV